MEVDLELDVTGLFCPEPVMMLHARVGGVPAGGVLKVVATDPSTQRDIPRFCQFLGHTLEAVSEEEDRFIYWIRVKSPNP